MNREDVLNLIKTDSLPAYKGHERMAERKAKEASEVKQKIEIKVNENAKNGAAEIYQSGRYSGD